MKSSADTRKIPLEFADGTARGAARDPASTGPSAEFPAHRGGGLFIDTATPGTHRALH